MSKLLERRGAQQTQAVSPSVAIPLLRAAYDEGRPELQELWAGLIAAAMDPQRSGRLRLSFIETLRQFDPLDALVLRTRAELTLTRNDNALSRVAEPLGVSIEEVQISVENLKRLNCIFYQTAMNDFNLHPFGKALLRACAD